jgi:hypothetical protein
MLEDFVPAYWGEPENRVAEERARPSQGEARKDDIMIE